MFRALAFFLSEAAESMRRHPAATVASLISMTAVLFVLGLLLLVTFNVRSLAQSLEERKGIVVFLESDLPEGRSGELAEIFRSFGEVENVRWVAREEALRTLERDLGGVEVEEILGDNPLPDAFILQCRPEARDAGSLESLASEMEAYPGVDAVLYGDEWVETLDRSLATLRKITLLVGSLAALAVVLVLGATLRLTLVHRRSALGIMRVIGTTYGYIRGPFLVAGVIQVTTASAASLVLLRLSVGASRSFLPGVRALPGSWTVLLVAGCAVLGLIGSFVALEPMLRSLEGAGRRSKARAGRAAAAAVVLLLACAGVHSQESISGYEGDLQQLKSRIEENRTRIRSLQSRREDLREMLERLERDVRLTQSYVSKLADQEARLEEDLSRGDLDLERTRERVRRLRDRLRKRLMDYYTSRRVDLVELLLSSENFAQLFARAHYISWSIHRDREDLAELAGEEAAHAEKTVELEARRDELKGLRMEKSQESIRLEARAKETKIETSRVERELETHRQELKALEAREARTTRLLTELEAKRSGGGFAGDGIEASKGRLPWPVDGRVVTGFGSQVHPRFKTRILNRGIDVAAARGTPIHAVGPGVVAVADWLSGYGNCVILDHGKGFYTLYAHAEEILVAKGQNVRQGDVLARVGQTDSVRGPGLHFEVRRGADALDPTLWLKRR